MNLRRGSVFVLSLLLGLLVTTAAVAVPACDKSWLTRDAPAFTEEELGSVCKNEPFLLSDANLPCAEQRDASKKALNNVCAPNKKWNQLKAGELLSAFQLYMANGNAVKLRATESTSPALPAEKPTDIIETQTATGEGAIGNPIAGVVAQGIADFLVTRAEAEVALFGSQEFFSKLCANDFAKPFFPTTCSLMKVPGKDETSSDPPSLGTLRNALIRDLRSLPKELILELLGSSEKTGAKNVHVLACSLDVGYALAQGLQAGEDAWQLLISTKVGNTPADSEGLARYATALDKPSTTNNCKDEWKVVQDVAQQLNQGVDVAALVQLQRGAPAAALRASSNLKSVTKAAEPPPADGSAPAGGRAAPDSTATQLARTTRAALAPLSHAFLVSASMATSQINEAGVRDVTAALFNTLAVILKAGKCGKDTTCSGAVDEGKTIMLALSEGYWSRAMMSLLTANDLDAVLFASKPKLRALLATVATVAEAKDSEGVQAAIEHYAAPVGSWRGKHVAAGFGLVGWVGANLSHEDVRKSKEDGGSVTPTLSVGFDLYGPIGKHNNERIGLQFPLIDVGNFASVRYNASGTDLVTVKTTPDIEVAQLFAPGAYGFISLWKSPFLLGGGCSWIPALRTVSTAGVNEQHAVVRCGGTLAVDVTIMPLVKF